MKQILIYKLSLSFKDKCLDKIPEADKFLLLSFSLQRENLGCKTKDFKLISPPAPSSAPAPPALKEFQAYQACHLAKSPDDNPICGDDNRKVGSNTKI